MRRDLYHSSEGQTWRKHKYIRKEGNRYIYPEDLKKSIGNKVHEIGSRINEKRNLSKSYTRDMGYPGSRDRMGVTENGIYSRSTGNAGAGNLRKGVEAGRRRAGIKPSGNVNGVQNNLRNKGYNASTDANWENANDNFNGSYNHRNTRKLDGTSYNDLRASRTKHDNEKIRQNRDRNYNRETPEKNELSRGTEAGRKRVQQKQETQAKNRSAAANGVGAKNQEFAKNQTRLRNTKKLYEKSGGKPLREIPLKVNGKTINLKMDDKQYDRYVAESPETTPQERAKAITKIRKKAAAANGTGAKNQEYAKAANAERKVKETKRIKNGKASIPTSVKEAQKLEKRIKDVNNSKSKIPTSDINKINKEVKKAYDKRINKMVERADSNDSTSDSLKKAREVNKEFSKYAESAKPWLKPDSDIRKAHKKSSTSSNANKPVKAPKEYYEELRSNTKNEKEFNDYLDKHNIARPDGSKPTTKNAQKVETWDNSKNIETWDNSKNIKTWDNQTAKKSTKNQKGHFTVSENGETVFVPDDKKTEKRVSKGKQIVNKIKNIFSKKKTK